MRAIIRRLLRIIARILYRIEVVGAEHVPTSGPALLLSNHVSNIDPALIAAALKRPLRFVMWRELYNKLGLRSLARIFDTIPVSDSDAPAAIKQSLLSTVGALNAGGLVCLFPEGTMTRTGHIRAFKRGCELIAQRAAVPIIPIHIDGIWGSVFTCEGGRYFWKWPKRLRPRVTVSFGQPLPPDSGAHTVRNAVIDLGSQAHSRRKRYQRPLHVQFWRAARRRWWRRCMADSTGLDLTGGKALAGALAMAHWIRKNRPHEQMVGLMVPASVPAALVNVAALIAGKVPVNLNFTGAHASLDVALKQCSLKTVFTSRKLVERCGLPERPEYLYLEDLLPALPRARKVLSLILAALLPLPLARRWLMHHGTMDDLATVIFTSGSTARPKGVMLSHHNLAGNIEAIAEVLQLRKTDAILGILPPFHSFGLTTMLWLPLTQGTPVVYHPNPLDARGVGRLAEKYRPTLVMATPSFYAVYTRGCEPSQFSSLRLAVAGGQKLIGSIADAFEKRFGLPLSEGYGCTELSPVVSTNVPDVQDGQKFQHARRRGSAGRPLPGLALKIINRDTLEPAPEGAEGILLVKGPSVMQGYMDDPEATAQVVRDGWYVTGDIARIDEDGFLYVLDRVSRFSKIGGEMVPHAAIEEALHRAAPTDENLFTVVSMADPIKGEKLVVLYEGPPLDPATLLRKMRASDVPSLWLPAPKDFLPVAAIPIMPSGKTNLAEARRLAQDNAKHQESRLGSGKKPSRRG